MRSHFVYLLKSTVSSRTYVGYTVDLKRRLRQHNGEIKGGAKYTRMGRPWIMVCYILGFPTETTALQYEWRVHNPPKKLKKKGGGLNQRIKVMKEILNYNKYTKKALSTSNFLTLVVWLKPEFNN